MRTARVLAVGRWVAVFILASLVVGCESLPRIHPDMAPHPATPVQIQSANGPLSPARSKAVLDALKKRGEETSIFQRHLALEEAVAGTPLVAGNKVVLLQDGPATYAAMFVAIRVFS